jgi:hypothetical protein
MATGPAQPDALEQRTRQALDYFIGQGWTREQAAGIVANLVAESNLQPAVVGDHGRAAGIAQWHADRQAAFQAQMNRPIQGSTLEEQLQFVQHELTDGDERGAGRLLRQAATAQEAGAIISRHYERPRDRDGEALRRGQRATAIRNAHPAPATLP